jgi:hypothetical protein
MPASIDELLDKYRPDILVITGHDAYSKHKGSVYRHTDFFIKVQALFQIGLIAVQMQYLSGHMKVVLLMLILICRIIFLFFPKQLIILAEQLERFIHPACIEQTSNGNSIAILHGDEVRLIADADFSDLEPVRKDEQAMRKKRDESFRCLFALYR